MSKSKNKSIKTFESMGLNKKMRFHEIPLGFLRASGINSRKRHFFMAMNQSNLSCPVPNEDIERKYFPTKYHQFIQNL